MTKLEQVGADYEDVGLEIYWILFRRQFPRVA